MTVIYEPKGKALEYAPLAANLYKGCGHGCCYCYAPSATYQNRESFYRSPSPRSDIIPKLTKEAEKLRGDNRAVLLCFTCDPYQPINAEYGLTRQAIEVLNANGLAVHILTKNGGAAVADFDLLRRNPKNAFSCTLTFDDSMRSLEWEPGADLPAARIDALRYAHQLGINTWVSFEPVIDVLSVFRLIDRTHKFVDLYKVGKWNYDKRAKEIDWPEFRNAVVLRLKKLNKPYLIKKDLLAA